MRKFLQMLSKVARANNPMYGSIGALNPMYGKSGELSPVSIQVNVYSLDNVLVRSFSSQSSCIAFFFCGPILCAMQKKKKMVRC
jgi:hypothetical protein